MNLEVVYRDINRDFGGVGYALLGDDESVYRILVFKYLAVSCVIELVLPVAVERCELLKHIPVILIIRGVNAEGEEFKLSVVTKGVVKRHSGEQARVVRVIGPGKAVGREGEAGFIKNGAGIPCVEIAVILKILLDIIVYRAVGISVSDDAALAEHRFNAVGCKVQVLYIGFVGCYRVPVCIVVYVGIVAEVYVI